MHQLGPKYLSEMCQFVSDMKGRINLSSATHGVEVLGLKFGRTKDKTAAYRSTSFAVCGPENVEQFAVDHTRPPWDNSVGVSKPNFSIDHTRLQT